ncbi:MAG: EamA family transporter [Pseudomonadota bacterium]
MNYTLVGLIAVLIWGVSLPAGKVVQEQIGPVAYIGILFLVTGILSLARQRFLFSFKKAELSHPVFYLRWAFFVLHEGLISISVGIVSLHNLPIVILINYLWPTAIILCSIFLAGVRVYRPVIFTIGTVIVLASLGYELLGGAEIGRNVFLSHMDNIAYGLTFLGAISWGLYCALSKRYGSVTGEARPIALFQLTLGLALPFIFLPQFNHSWNLNLVGAMVLGGICLAQALAYYAWDIGMRLGNIVVLSLLADFIPWVSLVCTTLILGVKIEKRTALSAVCLVIGALITRFATRTPSISTKDVQLT